MRLAVLVSGRGSNLAAVLDAVADGRLPDIEPMLVISNRAGVPALAVAATHGVPSRVLTGDGHPGAAFWDPPEQWRASWPALVRSLPVMVPAIGPRLPRVLRGLELIERAHPRDSFDGHTLTTPWDPLQRAYFNGYALWTYLTSPFLLALPGLSVRELAPVEDNGVRLVGFQVQFGPSFASHSTLQEFYFGPDLLLARHDYRVDIAGGFSAVQYISELVDANGILVPTRRRAYRCDEDGKPNLAEVMVSIDKSDVRFS